MSRISINRLLASIILMMVFGISFIYGVVSESFPVIATYCDGSTVSISPYSFVTRTDGSTFNCYNYMATPIQNGYRYGFEDKDDADYDDLIVECWVSGNHTSSPVVHVKFVSKEATYKHWLYIVYNGMQYLVFKADEASPGMIFDIPLPIKQCEDFEINVEPHLRTIKAGESTFYTATIKALGGFSEDVQLRVEGLPSGASETFDINPLPITGESKLDITTTSQVAVGTYILTITGETSIAADAAQENSGNHHSTQVVLKIEGEPLEPDFEILAIPSERSILQGDTTDYSIILKSINGFSENVNLSVEGLPSGVSGVFSVNPLSVNSESKLNIATTPQVIAGTYILTIKGEINVAGDLGQKDGEANHSTQVKLIINEKPPEPDFQINVVPSQQTIIQGDVTNYTISIGAINGFSGDVSLSVEGLPTGATANFSSNPLAVGNHSELNITTTLQVITGTHLLTVKGAAGGKVHSATVTLKINEKPPEPDFSILVTPNSQEIHQGDSTEYGIKITGLNGFNSAVNLTISGLPTDTSFIVTPNPITPGNGSVLTINTINSTPIGDYLFTITGSGGGKTQSVQVGLKIKEKLPEPDFTLEVEPDTQSTYPGESIDFNLKLTSIDGFSKVVELYTEGLPQGMSAKFLPGFVKPTGQSKMTLELSDSISPGTYQFNVSARGDGIKRKKQVTITVKEMPLEPDFDITATPGTRTLKRGESTNYSVTVTALNDFSEEVSLQVSGTPQGATAKFNNEKITPTGETQLQVTTTTETPVGDHILTITGKGSDKEHSVTVKLSVVCQDFSVKIHAEPLKGSAPLTVQFNAGVHQNGEFSDDEFQYQWNFGDDITSDQQNPEHTYLDPGKYIVVLSVTGKCGITKTATATIDVVGFAGSVSKAFSVAEAFPGDELFINIEIKNTSSFDFSNVSLFDTLSPYLVYLEDNAGVNLQRSGQQLKWQFQKLGKGEVIQIAVKVKISDDAPQGTITNVATLSHNSLGEDEQISSNTASLLVKAVSVFFQKQVEQTNAKPDELIKYRLILKNNSDIPLTGIKVTDELSPHLEYDYQSSKLGFKRQGRFLQWSGVLDAQQQEVIIIKARVQTDVFSGTHIQNMARLEAVEIKSVMESNTVETVITSESISPSNVRFTKRSEVPQTEVGRIIRFNITVNNMSNSNLITPVVEDALPQGFSYVKASSLLNNQRISDPQGTRRLIWSLPLIGPKQTMVLRFQVVIGADARRGRNINHATLRATDNSGQEIFLEASAFVNVSSSGFIFYSGVEGTVFLDRDDDNFYSMEDTPLEGIEVRLSTGEKAITNMMGLYSFQSLFPGEYAVGVNTATLPEKYKLASPYPKAVVLADGLTDTADFAVKFSGEDEEKSARLQGRVFFDKNQNKVFDGDDTLAQQFKAQLDNTLVTSGSNGSFVFSHLKPGAHTIEIIYGPKAVKKEIILNKGKNQVDIPLRFTGLKIIVSSER